MSQMIIRRKMEGDTVPEEYQPPFQESLYVVVFTADPAVIFSFGSLDDCIYTAKSEILRQSFLAANDDDIEIRHD